jgi:hypothetical protein
MLTPLNAAAAAAVQLHQMLWLDGAAHADKLLLFLHRVGAGWRPAGWRTDTRCRAVVRRAVRHLGGARHRSGAARAQGATSVRHRTSLFSQCSEPPFDDYNATGQALLHDSYSHGMACPLCPRGSVLLGVKRSRVGPGASLGPGAAGCGPRHASVAAHDQRRTELQHPRAGQGRSPIPSTKLLTSSSNHASRWLLTSGPAHVLLTHRRCAHRSALRAE